MRHLSNTTPDYNFIDLTDISGLSHRKILEGFYRIVTHLTRFFESTHKFKQIILIVAQKKKKKKQNKSHHRHYIQL